MNGPTPALPSTSNPAPVLPSPTLMRARATVVATEATTLGLSAALHLALILAALQRPVAAAHFIRAGLLLAAGLATLGGGWLLLVRYLRLGRAADPADPLWRSLSPALALTATLALSQLVVVGLWWAQPVAIARQVVWTLPVPMFGLAVVALRALAALEGRSRTPVADLILAASHGLLGGLASCMLVGLLAGQLSAELTYELGIGTSMAALWTTIAAARVLASARSALSAETAAGRRWPTSQGGLRSAALVLVLGVAVPATVLSTALLAARLTGVELACVALAVSVHTLRYAGVTMRYGATMPSPTSADAEGSQRDGAGDSQVAAAR